MAVPAPADSGLRLGLRSSVRLDRVSSRARAIGHRSAGAIARSRLVITGRATVIDGDTIEVEGTAERIRLYGIDAPEGQQTCEDASGRRYLCGSRSADHLVSIIGRNGRLSCVEEDRDRYDGIVAACSLSDGGDIGEKMIRSGWAVHFTRYSDGRYAAAEREAKDAGHGVSEGSFVTPAEWSQGERPPSELPEARAMSGTSSAACRIKGNISGNGRIYHMPIQEHLRSHPHRRERW